MTLAIQPTQKRFSLKPAIHKIMEAATSHEFRFILKLVLVLYNVVLAHSAITGHPIPFSDAVVMAGLITAEVSLVSLILQVTMAKVDSETQRYVTIFSILFISIAVAINAMAGISVISEIEPIGFIVSYTQFVSPMLPIAVLLMVFMSDASSDKVQRTIRQAIADSKIESARQDSELKIAKSEQAANLQETELENEARIATQTARNEINELELLRDKAVRAKATAQINAQIEIAQNEAAVMVEVAKRATATRKTEMFAFLDSDEFVKTQRRGAKRDALNLIKSATEVTTGGAENSSTGN